MEKADFIANLNTTICIGSITESLNTFLSDLDLNTTICIGSIETNPKEEVKHANLNTTICIGSITCRARMALGRTIFKYNNLYRFNISRGVHKPSREANLNTTICIGSMFPLPELRVV